MKPKCTFSIENRGVGLSYYLGMGLLLEYTVGKTKRSITIGLDAVMRKENGEFREDLYKDPFFYSLLKPYYNYVVEEPNNDYYDTIFFTDKKIMEEWLTCSKKDETYFKVQTIEEFFNIEKGKQE